MIFLFGSNSNRFTTGKIDITTHKQEADIIVRVTDKSRGMRWTGHVARMGAKQNEFRTLVGKSEEKRPLGRPRRRCVDSIKIDLKERMGWYALE
jgi:hypothetical protein